MHVQECRGSEPGYTNGRKDFILGPRLKDIGGGGTTSFQSSSRGEEKIFKAAFGGTGIF